MKYALAFVRSLLLSYFHSSMPHSDMLSQALSFVADQPYATDFAFV